MSLIKRVVGVILVGFFMKSMVKRSQMLREWRIWAYRIAAVVRNLIPHVEFSVMGSVVRGDSVGGSDVDVLVVSVYVPEKLAERAKLKSLVEEKLNLPYYRPFEIYMLKPKEAELYLRRARGFILKVNRGGIVSLREDEG